MRAMRGLSRSLPILIVALPFAAGAGGTTQSVLQLTPTGVATFPTGAAAPAGDSSGALEIRGSVVSEKIPRSGGGLSAARVPADHVPAPAANGISLVNPGFFGFPGLTHFEQRFAGSGPYANTQFSLEPPDQGLCVGNGYVVEAVNTALRVFNTAGEPLTDPIAINQFFGLKPEIIRTARVFGDFTSDPRCLYDAATKRWFITVLQADVNPSTGGLTGTTHVEIAVSQTSDPTGDYTLYAIDTTHLGAPGCGCLGDQPLIGADANGFFISTNEFGLVGPTFNGAQIYAISKKKLINGLPAAAVHFVGGPLEEGISYSVQPASTPAGGAYATAAGGTEYFVSALDFTGTLDNRIAVWAVTNTQSLDGVPNLAISHSIVASQVYGQPPASQQRPGPTPLAASLSTPASQEQLELLDSGDDRMQAAVYVNGQLWSALATVVQPKNGPSRAGAAWFVVNPSVARGAVSGQIAAQGYVSVDQASVIYPSIAASAAGKAAISFTLVGPDYFPTAAYASLDQAAGSGDVHIAGAGTLPEDGFTGYKAFTGGRVARWGDYGYATADEDGNLWFAAEYISSAPRSYYANWDTFISRVTP